HEYGAALQGFAAKMSDEQADELARDGRIKYVEPNRMIVLSPCKNNPNHPKCGDGGDGGDGGSNQETPWGISRVGGAGDGTGTSACVLDTGVDLDHPDLNVDVAKSVSFVNGESVDDGHGHGTHVAGTIGAVNNNEGVIGVAAGATIVGIKVLSNTGSGTYDDVIAGINHVAANSSLCDVANMSLGGGFSQAVNDAVENASNGTPFTLAAGNESSHAQFFSPASAEGNNIYTISAFERRRDRFASYSNYGNPPVDYAAPGSSVKSTYKNGGYATLSGTSMAAPHVAGILLLGAINTYDTVRNDPDRDADPIAHR
ncbi:MAG: S8 family serine peptidase, partial [Rhodothermia bacterium]|nr:S8 family serine peptidase [Rhodothermia bacterium]